MLRTSFHRKLTKECIICVFTKKKKNTFIDNFYWLIILNHSIRLYNFPFTQKKNHIVRKLKLNIYQPTNPTYYIIIKIPIEHTHTHPSSPSYNFIQRRKTLFKFLILNKFNTPGYTNQ